MTLIYQSTGTENERMRRIDNKISDPFDLSYFVVF